MTKNLYCKCALRMNFFKLSVQKVILYWSSNNPKGLGPPPQTVIVLRKNRPLQSKICDSRKSIKKIHENLWKSSINLWKSIKIYGNLRKSMETLENLWKSYDHFWKSDIFNHSLYINDFEKRNYHNQYQKPLEVLVDRTTWLKKIWKNRCCWYKERHTNNENHAYSLRHCFYP